MKSALKLPNNITHNKNSLKFAGPLKILVIEAKADYCKTVWCAICLGLSNVMIGAVNMVTFMYSTKVGDAHPIICTLAFHFFSAQAILSLNYANGWSTPMRLRHRKVAHVVLHVCGMVFAIVGIAPKLKSYGPPQSVHGITGIAAAAMGCLNMLLGIGAMLDMRFFNLSHMGFGIPIFIMSSISICLGFFTANFREWANYDSITLVLLIFVVFYTIFIITTVIIKFIYKF